MKAWDKPELKVFSVRLDENIASSGDDGGGSYEMMEIYHNKKGVLARDWEHHLYYVSGGIIQDTGFPYWEGCSAKNDFYYTLAEPNQVSSCRE